MAVATFGMIDAAAACVEDARDFEVALPAPARWPSGLETRSWTLCSLIGPDHRAPGIWGSDLGFTARAHADSQLTMLFGDTWASPIDGCQYPGSSDNDLQASLPVERPPQFQPGPPLGHGPDKCALLSYTHERADDVTSWRRIRVFPNAAQHTRGASLDMSGLRTPLAAFSDGARMFGLFQRYDPVECETTAECPAGTQCSTDPEYRGLPLGECSRLVKLTDDPPPDYCRDDEDCVPGTSCKPVQRGACVSPRPFEVDTPRGPFSPPWYRDDPKRALSSVLHVGAAIWPDSPADYAVVARFATNRFQNATARTVAYFDPEHPENNDYRPGYHTLLIWGRGTFVESAGAQALPFLLYVPLSELRGAPGDIVWRPRFFAGYHGEGHPAWSERESDAKPIYGIEPQHLQAKSDKLEWSDPEFDQVAQMSLSWVAPLSRWVMFYGGDLPAFMVLEPRTGKARKPVHKQRAIGAIHMRTSPHPWGALRAASKRPAGTRSGLDEVGWSSAEPVLTRGMAAQYLACASGKPEALSGCQKAPDELRPWELLKALGRAVSEPRGASRSLGDIAGECIGGAIALTLQDWLSGDRVGRLYGPNIIDEWTHETTDDAQRTRGERSVEVYWNVSTWNPYQVVLVKTQLNQAAEPSRVSFFRGD